MYGNRDIATKFKIPKEDSDWHIEYEGYDLLFNLVGLLHYIEVQNISED